MDLKVGQEYVVQRAGQNAWTLRICGFSSNERVTLYCMVNKDGSFGSRKDISTEYLKAYLEKYSVTYEDGLDNWI